MTIRRFLAPRVIGFFPASSQPQPSRGAASVTRYIVSLPLRARGTRGFARLALVREHSGHHRFALWSSNYEHATERMSTRHRAHVSWPAWAPGPDCALTSTRGWRLLVSISVLIRDYRGAGHSYRLVAGARDDDFRCRVHLLGRV